MTPCPPHSHHVTNGNPTLPLFPAEMQMAIFGECPAAPALAPCQMLVPPLSPSPVPQPAQPPARLSQRDILQGIICLQEILNRLLSPAGDLSQCRGGLGHPLPTRHMGTWSGGALGWVGAAAPPCPAPSVQPSPLSCLARVSPICRVSAPAGGRIGSWSPRPGQRGLRGRRPR